MDVAIALIAHDDVILSETKELAESFAIPSARCFTLFSMTRAILDTYDIMNFLILKSR